MTHVNIFREAEMKKTLAIGTLILILALTTLTIPKNVSANTDGNLVITDRTGQHTTLTHDQITALPSITEEAVLSCYGSQVADGQWTGVKISDLLSSVGADTAGGSIDFTAQDGYRMSIPMETALLPGVILAYAFDSSPIQETYRLVVPEANGNVWIALVVSMMVSDVGAPAVVGRSANVFDATKDFTQNNQQTSSTPTPSSTVKPSSPTPQPSIPTHITPTIAPTNTTNNTTNQPTAQSAFILDPVFGAVAGVIAVLIVVSLLAVRQKRVKADV
jgi:hypothetical protein